MAVQRTLGILKPDLVEKNQIGAALAAIEESGLKLVGLRQLVLSRRQAEGFYYVHKERPFFGELVEFMTRGPVVVFALEGDDAVARYRKLMGATNPADAEAGTLRARFGKDIGENAVHGSDSAENAAVEVAYFFPGYEVL